MVEVIAELLQVLAEILESFHDIRDNRNDRGMYRKPSLKHVI